MLGITSMIRADIIRRQFGVVPQFPYLFKGSLRSNLDRTELISDRKLNQVLEEVGLSYLLNHPVDEGGINFSLGERQLICLARVLACDRPIILLDEPTSSLDPLTDERIHSILRTSLKHQTVLAIAHRRESLKDYDTVIELKGGRVSV
jgi:ABC-type multidrug transport system fused ATPase/permease subunit